MKPDPEREKRLASLRRQLMSYARMEHDDTTRAEWAALRKEYDELT